MAVKKISLKLVAYSDAAGKFDANAPLNGNEDNFMVDADLSDDVAYLTSTNEAIPMSEPGCMMAVADGMGGQNAGEVAAEIAIETVAEFFKSDRLTPEVIASPKSRAKYITDVIIEADRRVKAATVDHPERQGMGSTIIITWIKDDDITVGWLGDSRAYRYNPVRGLEPISVDHTYVQELVNKGIITYDETFGHPQGNIVTRSLGDPLATPPSPEHVNLKLYNGDIILMCSDGLSGVVPDRPSHGIADSLETIIA
ncbi:MAG: PP2C family protein-serine/threonine phosphatase, partial [Muribaculaceae bacterium]